MSDRKWVRSSLRHLAGQLRRRGVAVCRGTVGRLLKGLAYSPRANEQRITGPPHPDRDRRFRYIERLKRRSLRAGLPVIGVDARKEERVGDFKDAGRTGRAEKVLILADAGGSHSCRDRLRKVRLRERLADRLGLSVTVCHYPRGASGWNPVEHRLFGPISTNWAGKPLRRLGTMLGYIRGTGTETGLEVEAELVERTCATKVEVSKEQMRGVRLVRRGTGPDWHSTLKRRRRSARLRNRFG